MMRSIFVGLLTLVLFYGSGSINANAQSDMPEIMQDGSLKEQLDYINERTRIYENYRAIREDIFQKMRSNTLDSLNTAKNTISGLEKTRSDLDRQITSLNEQISSINKELSEAINNRDSLMFFGISMSKSAYNKLLWSIIIGLLVLTVIVFLMFKRSFVVTKIAKTDLEDIKKEFEDFRKVAHENKEKLIVSHFNEIKKLKEMGR
ncbi:MAG: hypothetical protein V2I37_14040 [Marinilabiliaceae bacterium]|jgi:peptidoglycan hydrolase CwlO-like protein|nr:hypothetical protein [Marinilabiliaceae bacterium]